MALLRPPAGEIGQDRALSDADAVALIARHLAQAEGEGWRLCGLDPEGIDFEREGRHARLEFAVPVDGPESCRRALMGLTKEGRAIAESSQHFQ